MSSGGMLSMTNQPRSSSAAEAVERPAPDMPVTSNTSLIVRTLLGGPRLARALQVIVEPGGHVSGQPGQRRQLVERGLAQRVQGAELLEQAVTSRRAQSLDTLQSGGDHGLAPLGSMKADGEAVGLVAQALDQVETLRAALEHDRLTGAGTIEQLLTLGQGHEFHLVGKTQRGGRLLGRVQLGQPAIDDDQVGVTKLRR